METIFVVVLFFFLKVHYVYCILTAVHIAIILKLVLKDGN